MEPDYDHPLLTPLVRAQDAVARLEASAEMASDAVAEGLRARLSHLEAAGWLRCAHVWIHPPQPPKVASPALPSRGRWRLAEGRLSMMAARSP